jgi:serine/threonine-protein kinase
MSASSDRNLVFGLLALQMDFVSREQLLDAMQAWMLAKQTPLGEVLRARGALSEEDRAALERLVDRHVQRHGGEQGSLAALHVEDGVREGLERLGDSEIHTTVASLAPTSGNGPARPTDTAGARYRRVRPHARGGLGEVFVALDEELRREVALKEIQERLADDTDSRSRFVREAEITGNLEHPGVVPVYGLGTYPDGRPFYAMRFIRGESMQAAIERFHQADALRSRDPGERSLALRDLLGRFVAVCDAVAYAHARGIIHRDLKPQNVILGEYGETLVVDWGLARHVADREGQTAAARPVTTSQQSTATEHGQVLGTLAYMPPEQAHGWLDELGRHSDVFALGATLYALLTGRPRTSGWTP